jgi:uncharacterized protein (TIGR02266 family)
LVDPNTRQAKRTPVTLKIKFKSATLEQFIERYAVDVSHGGIFIRTKEPLPVGTQMRFEFQLRDATPLITGEGTVVWTRENDPARPGVAPGMGVRFDRLGEGSQEVLDKILAQKAKSPTAQSEGGKPPAFNEVPTKVAPSPLVGALAAESKPRMGSMAPPRSGFPDERTDATPLPKPMPFHSDVDDFPEEAFEEATKVRSLDELVAQTALGDHGMARTKTPEPAQHPRPGTPSGSPPRAAAPAASPPSASSPGRPGSSGPERPTLPMPPPVAPQVPAPVAAAPVPAASAPSAPMSAASQAVADELAMRRAAKNAEGPRERGTDKTERSDKSERAERSKLADSRSDSRTGKSAPATTRIATPLPLPEMPRSSDREPMPEPSRTPIGIIAALVMVAAAAAGVWFFVLRKDAVQTPATGSTAPAATATATAPPDPAQAIAAAAGAGTVDAAAAPAVETPPIPAETIEVTLTSSVKGASIAVDNTTQAGPSPLVAKLEKGKTYTVKVTAPGHQPSETQVGTDRRKVDIKLAPLPQVVRVTSTPAGARIYVDGRDTKLNTPAEVPLSASEVTKSRVTIGLRKSGFEKFNEALAKTTFGESEGKLLASLDARLEVARVRAPVPREPVDDGPATAPDPGGTPSETPATPPPSETPSGSTTPSAPPVTPTAKPEPKVEPKPPEPAKPAEPKPAEPGKGSAEPTPDWMKP